MSRTKKNFTKPLLPRNAGEGWDEGTASIKDLPSPYTLSHVPVGEGIRGIVLFLFCSLLCVNAHATVFFVRAGATGLNNGSSWTNAWKEMGQIGWTSVKAGDTVCLGGGAYTQMLDVGTSGTSSAPVTIKRATSSDALCGAGLPAGADSQVSISAGNTGIQINNQSYVTVDGVVANGIKVTYSTGFQGGLYVDGAGSGNIVRNLELQGPGPNYNYTSACANGIAAYGSSGLLISHVLVHDSDTLINVAASNVTFEYCTLRGATGNSTCHGNSVFADGGSQNGVFRYNDVSDMNAEGFFFTGWGGSPGNWKLYGNVFHDGTPGGTGRGIEIRQDYSYSNLQIYNNTFVNLPVGGIYNRTGETGNTCSGCVAIDNLSYNAGNTLTGITANNNVDDSTNRFVALSSKNYHLASALAGATLAAEFNKDPDGVTRGADGVWDIGAFEFVSGAPPPPPPSGSACDVNKDNTTNIVDVQQCVNQSLGVATCTADINKDGICNVVDVQRVVNAALGGQCVTN